MWNFITKSIKTEILVVFGLVLFIIISLFTVLSVKMMQKEKLQYQRAVIRENIERIASIVKYEVENEITQINNIAEFSNTSIASKRQILTRDAVTDLLRNTLKNGKSLTELFMVWEPNAFDGLDTFYRNTQFHDSTGRFIPYFIKRKNGTIEQKILQDYSVVGKNDYYRMTRKKLDIVILDPFLTREEGTKFQNIQVAIPIYQGVKFYGVISGILRLESLQEILDKSKQQQFKNDLSLISNEGKIIAYSGKNFLLDQSVDEFCYDCKIPEYAKPYSQFPPHLYGILPSYPFQLIW